MYILKPHPKSPAAQMQKFGSGITTELMVLIYMKNSFRSVLALRYQTVD